MTTAEGPADWAARRPWWRDYLVALIGPVAFWTPLALWGPVPAIITTVVVFALWYPVACFVGDWAHERRCLRAVAARRRQEASAS